MFIYYTTTVSNLKLPHWSIKQCIPVNLHILLIWSRAHSMQNSVCLCQPFHCYSLYHLIWCSRFSLSSSCHCLATHPSASDLLTTMARYRSIYLFIYSGRQDNTVPGLPALKAGCQDNTVPGLPALRLAVKITQFLACTEAGRPDNTVPGLH